MFKKRPRGASRGPSAWYKMCPMQAEVELTSLRAMVPAKNNVLSCNWESSLVKPLTAVKSRNCALCLWEFLTWSDRVISSSNAHFEALCIYSRYSEPLFFHTSKSQVASTARRLSYFIFPPQSDGEIVFSSLYRSGVFWFISTAKVV